MANSKIYVPGKNDFLDWAKNDHRGECCGLNAIYYGALQVLLHMAEYKGDAYMIGHAREAISLIGQHFSERFFNREKQVFVDANVDGFYSDTVSESGNMLSVYFGLASADEAKCAIAHIIVDRDISFVEACPFLGAYTLRALAKAGREDLIGYDAKCLIRPRKASPAKPTPQKKGAPTPKATAKSGGKTANPAPKKGKR